MIIADKIIEKANRIYQQLGICHTEHVFSKALQLELYNLGAVLVERERAAPCFYKCSNGKTHILSIERIDLLAYFPNNEIILLELKSTPRNKLENHIPQVKKYITSLNAQKIYPKCSLLINFPITTDSNNRLEVESIFMC